MNKVYGFLQARMSSNRLPGKVLMDVENKRLLQYLVDRLSISVELDKVIVLTSNESSDDPIDSYCKEAGIEVFRGSLNNVSQRFLDAADFYGCDAFVRISADSPLLDSKIVDQLVYDFRESNHDLVTNVFPRSFPKGQSVEVCRTQLLRDLLPEYKDALDLELITTFFYKNSARIKIKNIANSRGNESHLNFCVDDDETLNQFKSILKRLDRDFMTYTYSELVEELESMLSESI